MRIDLNADLGESFGAWRLGDDAAMLEVVTSANVACGFHAGDPLTLARTCAAALERGVVVGAQVGYRDLAGFGRRFIDATHAELRADVLYQLGALDAMCRVAGGRVSYLKPHGALYHAVLDHEGQAQAVVDAVLAYDATLPILGLTHGCLYAAASAAGLRVVPEAFADRAYTPDGRLLSRRQAGAVLHDADEVATRMVRLATTGELAAYNGNVVAVQADSICTHGDSPGAVAMARAVRAALEGAGVAIRPFVDAAAP
ncbi:MAG TPA: 5-oxoprolinase subunit PxpA [Dermatophilaceae bacterium]|nr:5-oxoprolinase subunit PxpA [Dermatophilaceae bacterium]